MLYIYKNKSCHCAAAHVTVILIHTQVNYHAFFTADQSDANSASFMYFCLLISCIKIYFVLF